MTGTEFELKVCQWLKEKGYWALNIPRSKTGQQPFDVIAIKGKCLLALDCKVMSGKSKRFPLERVEVNQWLAFHALQEASPYALVGLMIWHDGVMYFVSYRALLHAESKCEASVELPKNSLVALDMNVGVRQ